MPPERWILWTWGPAMGPAVLYWGSLLLILVVAWGLGRLSWLPMRAWQWVLLGLGLSTVDAATAVTLVAWFLLFGWRKEYPGPNIRWRFNARQIFLFLWTLAALAALGEILRHGLLGYPDMQIRGNQSSQHLLQWFQDRSTPVMPEAGVFSVPIFAYRGLMLVWSLWLAAAMLGWIRWGWGCYVTEGMWRHKEARQEPADQS